MVELPTGTVTFLFTDLESSTRLWEQHPDAMRDALARHDEILRAAVEDHDGHVVKTTGDGLHAAFATAHDAVATAVDAQRALTAERWALPDPLRIRMGLHTGETEIRAGDYYGTAVNRAARLMSVAHGGQIVVSLATSALVRDDGSVELADLGEHRLRDLTNVERVFEVRAPGLATGFGPLRTLDALPGNLPRQVTTFVGRDDDVADIVELMNGSALVTLIGTGGVGKTRLAVQVAAEVLPRFADGAWFCDLSAAGNGEAMAQVIATALGCVQRPGLSLAESIAEYVKVRQILLVLDNCEHLLDEAVELVDAVRAISPRVGVLATSREAFGVAGERVVRVRSLPTPDSATSGDEMLRSAAVRLFVDRAGDAGAAAAEWSSSQWAAVGEICRRVDGIPLAIELAAARVAVMRPTEIAAHLDERFRLLTGTRRGRVERHQTLRATVEWSYQLLEPDERVVFERLGVFAGTFDALGATAVVGADELDEWQIVEAVASLVAKSMLVVEEGPDDTTRYGMLETLRQFAREQLEETGDADRWRRRHAEHYAAFAATAGTGLRGHDEVRWVARTLADLDNLRAAVDWSLDRDDPDDRELGVRVIAAFGYGTMAATAMYAWAGRAAASAEDCPAALRSPVLALAATDAMFQGDTERARAIADEAVRDGIVADSSNPFSPLQTLALIEMSAGNADRALEAYEAARAGFDAVDDPWSQSFCLGGLAAFEAMVGRFDEARADADAALELARTLQNPTVLANALQAKAWAVLPDDPAAALDLTEQYLELYRRGFGLRAATVGSMAMAGGLRHRLGDPDGALALLREAVLIARDMGARPQLSAALDWSLSPLVKLGRPEPATAIIGALNNGALADFGNFPMVGKTRAKNLERIRSLLGDSTTDQLLARGATMTYDEIIEYALEHLEAPETNLASPSRVRDNDRIGLID